MQLLYVDSNVYLDYFLDRHNPQNKPLGQIAGAFFVKVLTGDYKILISDKISEEILGELGDPSQFNGLREFLKSKIIIIPYTDEDLKQAEALDAENRNDALHAILANQHKAKYVVTRNIRHLNKYRHLVEPILPEEL